MATTSISGLPETTTIDSVTVAPFDYSGGTFKVTVATLGSFINTNATTISASGNVTGGNLRASGVLISTNTVSAVGNITGGNLIISGAIVDSGQLDIQTSAGNANIVLTPNGTGNVTTGANISAAGTVIGGNLATGGTASATGNITGGNVTTAGVLTVNSGAAATAIVNGAGNAVGNIGSSSRYFNQIFAQATTALYADLAEVYESDADYSPGTVVSFGGSKEVVISTQYADPAVAGVISKNPSYLMNNGLTADHRAIVALTGRVPTSVTGTVVKGAMMVSAGNGCACACATPAMGTVIGKALENFDGENGIIEIVVGRM